jgi:hypothetical protein
MRALSVAIMVVGVLWACGVAEAEPIGVRIECEDPGRTKACPAFLQGFVDAREVLLLAPRATADVIVYANATEVALVDRMHLRFVSKLAGMPPVIELDVDLDTRADDDTQRAQLEPAFLRGIMLYVASRFSSSVTVTLGAPEGDEAQAKQTSPYDFELGLSAFGSRSGPYQNYNGTVLTAVSRTTKMRRLHATAWSSGGIDRKPPLELDDGRVVSVNANNYNYNAGVEGNQLLNQHYSVGAQTTIHRDDPKGQYRYLWDAKVGFEWDRFRANDPRGNQLAVLYVAGYQVEGYNIRNVLGERFAHYPIHKVAAVGSYRKDKVLFGLDLQVGSQMFHPMRRHELSASPSLEIQLGARVDLSMSFSITKRALPAPDEREINPEDYAQLSRLSYAEPLSMSGTFTFKLHWDRTNGVRNDRLTNL